MKRRTQLILFRILFFLYVATVLLLCFCRFNQAPNVPFTILGIPTDKVVHFCMFFPFPILAFLAFDPYTQSPLSSLAFGGVTLAVGFLLALGTEWGQATFTYYRSGDRTDLLADGIALTLSTAIVVAWDILKQHRHPHRPCEKASS